MKGRPRSRFAHRIAGALLVLAVVVGVADWLIKQQPRPAPDVAITTIQGTTLQLASLKGKAVLVNFWATTCAVCMREMPRMVQLFEKYRTRGYETVAVAMPYDPPNRVLDYAKRKGMPFTVALDVDGNVLRAFGDVPGTPTSFLIDRNGVVIRKYLGEPDYADLEKCIDAALGAG